MNYQESLDFLYEQLPIFQRIGKAALKKDLTNTLVLAEARSNPHHGFKSIHIAGTNGKGSTAHMFASVLQEAGYKVGLYTSPHLKSFRERIRINGEEIDKDFVVDFVENCKSLMLEVQPSFFEMTVIMAFEYFAKQNVDVAVIEAGLGGRLDSTNVISPVLSVITSVGLDHEDILGQGIVNIAKEKSGIIKSNTPIVLGSLTNEAHQVMKDQAMIKHATLVDAHEGFVLSQSENRSLSLIETATGDQYSFDSELGGNSLLKNVPVIIKGIEQLRSSGFHISKENVINGVNKVVSNTGLKGRWQLVRENPTVIADIGHNQEALEELMLRLSHTKKEGTKLHVVWGMAADKSIEKIFDLLLKDAQYYFCAAKIPRALSVDDLQKYAKQYDLTYHSYESVDQAYEAALKNASVEDLIFVGGSTFVVAEIKDL
ncbi:bifunctional folylpolyglutamate synthase/dihydrofolate synthase [Reichenbachiella agarivorans]|uniref:Dihydrofolate synthase/folylpolyglutamate synthase n=1 Tax=Reichenbachiella agarivorans TaxID=2979464 RepID=A0ABY6CNP0_9BACT|nr:folylpolyglutamate synthase/dihydrofolate synthase family protein [Reichenbachiella agarivorans]UXP31379.1 bifunctional folylpolyglutamate synthase/dihydrofolate synthase [Reichenbachiella agarivorans]